MGFIDWLHRLVGVVIVALAPVGAVCCPAWPVARWNPLVDGGRLNCRAARRTGSGQFADPAETSARRWKVHRGAMGGQGPDPPLPA